MVKVNFKSQSTAEPAPAAAPRSAPDRQPSISLKLKIKDTLTASQAPQAPVATDNGTIQVKQKRAYNKKPKAVNDGTGAMVPPTPKGGKKRARKEEEDDDLATRPAKLSRVPSIVTFKMPEPSSTIAVQKSRGPKLKVAPPPFNTKLSFKNRSASATTPRLKVKSLGRAPERPLGVGYDSEAEDVEVDPAIENQFILRMLPGEDCDYLREAIAASGLRPKADEKVRLGPDVWMRFFDKQGRRGIVSVRGNLYAAAMLDLPCVVEGMKSWDKRGFFKAADICQILLVLGKIKEEDDAKVYPLPPEVDREHHQYPHGLTPPMHYVRKRRFRKRINIRQIEKTEAAVDKLFEDDRKWEALHGGRVTYEWVDEDDSIKPGSHIEIGSSAEADSDSEAGDVVDGHEYAGSNNAEDEEMEEYEVAEGREVAEGEEDAEGEDEDADMLAQMMMEGFAQADQDPMESSNLHDSPDTLQPPETPASGVTSGDDEDEEGEGASPEDTSTPDAAVEEDDAEASLRQERAQQQEEVEELQGELRLAEEKWKRQVNPLLKMRAAQEIRSLKSEIELKMSSMGIPEEED